MKIMNELIEEMNDLYNTEIASELNEESTEAVEIKAAPGDPCCTGTDFCCMISVPVDAALPAIQDNLAAVFSDPSCITIGLPSPTSCTAGRCTIPLYSYPITACLKIYSSIRFLDLSNNPFYSCCSDCMCFSDCVVSCSGVAPAPAALKFSATVNSVTAAGFAAPTDGCPNVKFYKVTGTIKVKIF